MYRNWLLILVLCTATCISSMAKKVESENLLKNAGFETAAPNALSAPAEWGWFSSGEFKMTRESNTVHSGQYSFRFKSLEKANTYCGIFQSCSVSSDNKYTFRAFVRRDKKDPMKGSVTGRLVIEWIDADGRKIKRIDGATWNRSLSALRWTPFQTSNLNPPKNAETAIFGIHLTDNIPGGKGSFLLDDVSVVIE